MTNNKREQIAIIQVGSGHNAFHLEVRREPRDGEIITILRGKIAGSLDGAAAMALGNAYRFQGQGQGKYRGDQCPRYAVDIVR